MTHSILAVLFSGLIGGAVCISTTAAHASTKYTRYTHIPDVYKIQSVSILLDAYLDKAEPVDKNSFKILNVYFDKEATRKTKNPHLGSGLVTYNQNSLELNDSGDIYANGTKLVHLNIKSLYKKLKAQNPKKTIVRHRVDMQINSVSIKSEIIGDDPCENENKLVGGGTGEDHVTYQRQLFINGKSTNRLTKQTYNLDCKSPVVITEAAAKSASIKGVVGATLAYRIVNKQMDHGVGYPVEYLLSPESN